MDKDKSGKLNLFWGVVIIIFFFILAVAIGKDFVDTVIASYK